MSIIAMFLIITFAILVMKTSNPIYVVLYLILTFFASSLLMFTLRFEFFALVFLMIYIGAVSVLFLFVVFSLKLKDFKANENSMLWMEVMIAALVLLPLLQNYTPFSTADMIVLPNFLTAANQKLTLDVLADVLYSIYSGPFLGCAMVLFIALLGTMVLTFGLESKNPKSQKSWVQIQSSPNARVTLYS